MREQAVIGGPRGLLKRWLDLLKGGLVTDFDHAERLVDREPVAGRVVDRLVVRHDPDEAVGVAGVR